MARRATYLPLSHDDYDRSLYSRVKIYGGGPGPLSDPAVLERVKARLRAGCRTVIVSRESGYTSVTNFYRAFKSATGWTPAAWRDAHTDGGSTKDP